MAAAPSTGAVVALFRSFLREGKKFPNYNVRSYVKRKARDEFRAHKQDADPAALSKLWSHAKEELEAVRRQAMVYHLYARQHKSVMDIPLQKVLKAQSEAVEQIKGTLSTPGS